MSDKIGGVFLYEKTSKIGTGHTGRTVTSKMYCIAKEIEDGMVEIHYLGANDEPIGDPEEIPKSDFVHKFTFQPYYFEQKKADKDKQNAEEEKKVNKHCALAEEHAKRKEYYSAQFEFQNALKIDEENLRANFGIGNVYLEMGETEKAREIFVKVSKIDAIFEDKNKHFFNDCAIQLRKQKLFDESIDYYNKAMGISPNDENLCFNLARAYFEKGEVEKAKEFVFKSLSLKPDFREGKALLNYIEQKGLEPEASKEA